MKRTKAHTTHHVCQEVLDKYGGKSMGCCCTGHKCKDKPKLTKSQEKRFDRFWFLEAGGDNFRNEIKQHLASELSKQKKEIIEEFERTRDLVQGDSVFRRTINDK